MKTTLILTMVIALMATMSAALQQKRFPDSPTGRALNALFDIMQSGDDTAIRAFIDDYFDPEFRDHFSIDEHVAQLRSLHEELGAVRVLSVDKPGPFSVILDVEAESSHERYRIELGLNPTPPHGITGIGVMPVTSQPVPDPPENVEDPNAVVSGDLGGKMDAVMRELEAEGFSGALIAVKNGEVLLHKGYGWADRERRVPVTTETVFDVASYAKSITRAGILKLEQEGKLSTGDPITRFFVNVPADKQSITIHHLLTMQSGLHEYHDDSGDFQPMTRDEAVQRILAQPLRFTPGEDRGYSNSGYGLLAAIIEIVSGMPYMEYTQTELFKPARLRYTGYYRNPRWTPEQAAHGYDAKSYGDENSPYHWPEITWACIGGGCLVSSPGEQGRWLNALLDHEILGETALDKLYTVYKKGADTDWGGEMIAFAESNDFGFTAGTFEFLGRRSYLFISTNTGRFSAPRVGERLARMMYSSGG
ncbi:MAG: beta-lactamase family protein [Candidatus Latescibacterota bacterium]|nr:MAG: beta-lactamase family protein [Candidatus Latescibacterota bacterium]